MAMSTPNSAVLVDWFERLALLLAWAFVIIVFGAVRPNTSTRPPARVTRVAARRKGTAEVTAVADTKAAPGLSDAHQEQPQ